MEEEEDKLAALPTQDALHQALTQSALLGVALAAGTARTFAKLGVSPAPTSPFAAHTCPVAPVAHHLDADLPAGSDQPLQCPPATLPPYAVPKQVGSMNVDGSL